jgi:hypothetical protein
VIFLSIRTAWIAGVAFDVPRASGKTRRSWDKSLGRPLKKSGQFGNHFDAEGAASTRESAALKQSTSPRFQAVSVRSTTMTRSRSPYLAMSSSIAPRCRTVAATLSPLASRLSVIVRPKPDDAPCFHATSFAAFLQLWGSS